MGQKFLILILLLMSVGSNIMAQRLYSRDFDAAVAKGTRTLDGVPGPNYKNNFSNYKIDVSFDPITAMLDGEEVVEYSFETPNSRIDRIVMNLYRNVYKKGVPRSRPCNPEDISDEGMVIESAQQLVDGKYVSLNVSYTNTKAILFLKNKVQTGGKTTIKVKWHVPIASQTKHRGGKYGSNSWFVPYWYPQIAVYCDLYGWDPIEHAINEEFLQEFANYDVTISLGQRMMCWATGELQNLSSIYSPSVVALYQKAAKSGQLTHIVTDKNIATALKSDVNQWHFVARNVNDFAFACSSEMFWSAQLFNAAPGRNVVAGAVYKNPNFADVIDWTAQTIKYLSTERPAYPYPYPHMTIFEGSGGMEFPMMVNEDFSNRYDSDFFTTSHEVTHSYFPFITGMYQNRYAFMDEGLTQFVPQYFQNSRFRSRNIINDASRSMQNLIGSDDNVPIMTPSYSQTNRWVFTVNSYWKPQIAYTVLEDAVGEDVMTKILHDFTQAWAGKHPHPFDFFHMCEKVSGKNLQELIHSWFYIKGVPDVGIELADPNTIVVRNLGDMMLPVAIDVNYADGTYEQIRRTALEWVGGKKEFKIATGKEVESASLDCSWIPDIDNSNNTIMK